MRKVEKSENFKKLDKVFESFNDKGDTMLSMFVINGAEGASFTGNPEKLITGFQKLILGGIGSKEDDVVGITASILVGLSLALQDKTDKGIFLRRYLLNDIIEATTGDMSNILRKMMKSFNKREK